MNAEILLSLAEQLQRIVRPLERALADEQAFAQFLRDFGWEIDRAAFDIDDVRAAIAALDNIAAAAGDFAAIHAAGGSPPIDVCLHLVQQLEGAFADIREMSTATGPAGFPAGAWAVLRAELPARLIIAYLEAFHPGVLAVLLVSGVVTETPVSAGGAADRVDYTRRAIDWEGLGDILDPASIAAERYAWRDTGPLAYGLLIDVLARAIRLLGLDASTAAPRQDLLDAYFDGGSAAPANLRELRIPIIEIGDEAGAFEARLSILPIPDGPPTSPIKGIAVSPAVLISGTPPETGSGPFSVEATGDFTGSAPSWIEIVPSGVRLKNASGTIDAAATLEQWIPYRAVLVGSRLSTHLALERWYVGLAVDGPADEPDVRLRLGVDPARVVVDVAEADGFLQRVLPPDLTHVDVTLGLVWSSKTGLHLEAAGLEVTIPLHMTLGPVEVRSLTAGLLVTEGDLTLAAGLELGVQLGPLAATVDGIGVELRFVPVPQGAPSGLLGDLDLAFSFKPPEGAALAIEAGPVTGGGFLFFDPSKEQYAGGLHLEFETLTLNAIGLLTTRMPDGSRGFSLLVIIQASGFAPIQLGFGFSLTGVGGLLGINRTVDVDVLRAGVRDRSLDAILFSPDDPTPRAPQIVSTLQRVFPPAANQYVFGPMALIAWGAPVTLVTIEVALILELPAPLRLIILGRVRATLPEPEHAIVRINLDVVGVVDFDQRTLSIDGSLYDSTVGPFALSGDMAARASWGDTPDVAMAIGGFHPAFRPPPGFPQLRRLALALSTGDNPRLRMEAYVALTANTVQVGARLELYVEAAGFALEGGLGFDTLIQFSPFRILAEIYARLALKRGGAVLMGLDIHVHLTGPAPWVLWGEASFKILFVSFAIPFRATFGREQPVPPIEAQEVWPVLRDSLVAAGNWSAQLPPERGRLVVLRDGAGADGILAHPLGTLTVSQSLVPLERTLDLFGSVPPKDYDRFAITGASGLEITGAATQHFAPAQFRRMSDAEKLASPSFERMAAGVRLAPAQAITFGHVQATPLDYEQVVILDVESPSAEPLPDRYEPAGDAVAALAGFGPAGTAAVRAQGRARFAPLEPGPPVAEPAFVVVTRDGLDPVGPDGVPDSYTAAVERLRARPDREALQVVRAEEVVVT